MSLVDYASSDDDVSEEEDENKPAAEAPMDEPTPPPTRPVGSSYQQSNPHSSTPTVEKLPDASQLFDSSEFSPNMLSDSYHSSRVSCVAAASAESASRKRESNSFASPVTRSKLPRGNMPHSKNIPDTLGGMLVPPQLRGRSNVVTEDVSKLFVKKPIGGSPQ